MARRRINTRFLSVVLTVLAVLAAVAVLARKLLIHDNPQQYITAGDAFVKDQQWDKAAANLGKAVQLMPKDPHLLVEYGDVLLKLAPQDSDYARQAVGVWRKAVDTDPTFTAAWQRMLDVYLRDLSQVEGAPQNSSNRETLLNLLGAVQETCQQINRLQPNDPQIAWILPSLTIRTWLLRIPLPLTPEEATLPLDKRLSDDQKVSAAMAQLTQVLHDHPQDVYAGFWVAQAKIRQGQTALSNDQPTDAESRFAEAAAIFDDTIKSKPANLVEVYMMQAQILRQLVRIETQHDPQQTYAARYRDALNAAQGMVDPKNLAMYTQVKTEWASATDPVTAEAVLRDVMAKNPGEIEPKIALAQLLDKSSARRADALAVLDQIPNTAPPGVSPTRRAQLEGDIANGQLLRAHVLSEEFADASDYKQREQLAAQTQALIDTLSAHYSDNWVFLKLKGEFEYRQGKYRDAIQTLRAAYDHMIAITPVRDSQLLQMLADAYERGQQSGDAIAMLEQAIQDPAVNNSVAPHFHLANLYLADRNIDRARPHLDWLAVRLPNNPDVIKLQIQALDPQQDRDAILALYQKLPENTPEAIQDKATEAHRINNDADALRLIKGLYTSDPKNTSYVYNLAILYSSMGQKDTARQLVADALKAKPDDSTLQLLNQDINGASTEAIADAAEDHIRKTISDPFLREMELANLAHVQGKTKDEFDHLKNAQKLQPDNPNMLDRVFRLALAQGRFDDAEACLAPLAKADADQAHGELYRFRFVQAKGDTQSALAIAQQMTSEFPEFSESWESLGEALQATAQYDDASAKYLQALSKQARNVAAMRGLIQCSVKLGKTDAAFHYIEDARHKFPEDAVYREMEIDFQLDYGDASSVLPTLVDAVKQSPDDPRVYEKAAGAIEKVAASKNSKGDTDAAHDLYGQARDILLQATNHWPDDLNFAGGLATAYIQLGDVPSAEAAIKKVADMPKWKDKPAPSLALAQVYINGGKPESAEAPLRDALAKSNGDVEVEQKLASLLIQERKYDQALAVLDANKTSGPILKERVEILLDLNKGDQAETEVNQAIKTAPADATIQNLLAFIYYREAKLADVRTLTTTLITADPNNESARYYRAMSSLQGKPSDPDAAIADLTYIRDHFPNYIEARLALADAYALKSNIDDGIHELEAALAADPQNRQVRLKLAEFYGLATPPRYLDAQQVLTDGLAMAKFKNDVDMLRLSALVALKLGDTGGAVSTIRTAMSLVSDKSYLIHDYLEILLADKDYGQVLTESDPLITDPKVQWWVYDLRGAAKVKSGDTDGADAEFNSALTQAAAQGGEQDAMAVAKDIASAESPGKAIALVSPRAQNDAMWKLILVPLYAQKGDQAGAIAAAESAMQNMSSLNDAQQEELLQFAGSLYCSTTPPNVDKAVGIYQQILDRHPADVLSMNNLACLLADTAKPPQVTKALEYSQRAYDLVQKTGQIQPLIYDTQGWVLILAGRVNEGIEILQKIADAADFPEVHYHLAQGYLRKGLLDNADRELDNATDTLNQAIADKQRVDTTLSDKIKGAKADVDLKRQANAKAQAGN